MQSRHLIDALVRHTTVLIAHVSTAAGIRAPLAHVADQVFYDLGRELERQGVRRKVVADMFGLAMRSYQKKTRRLTESLTEKNRTLWESVLETIVQKGPITRAALEKRFRRDDERDVGAVINDLVESGLVYVTGRGQNAVYGIPSARDAEVSQREQDHASVTEIVWMAIYRSGPLSNEELGEHAPFEPPTLSAALADLEQAGRIEKDQDGHWRTTHFVVPVGTSKGWEAAVLDHFQAVTGAIAAKLAGGSLQAQQDDVVGGGTISFELWEGHPLEGEVKALLRNVRAQANTLWQQTHDPSCNRPENAARFRVWFYFGQNVQELDDGEGGA